MKIKTKHIKMITAAALLLLALALCGCGKKEKLRNNANLSLDLGIGNTHFEDESDFPAPLSGAYLDVNASKIVICGAYESSIIETPFIYNTSSTAYPRMKLETSGNKMFVIYCPDISMPNIQFASTDDGGLSWEQSTLSLKDEMDTIDNFIATFWTPRHGALIAANGAIETFIYLTEDGGKSWKLQEQAPPEQDWHDILEYGTFLNKDIGIISYDFHSKPANQPNVYLTTNGGKSWAPLYIIVPESVMDSYAKAGKPFYDGEKINIPINIFNSSGDIVNTVYFVSYDLAANWQFFVDDGGRSEQLRKDEMEKWVAANRVESLLFAEYEITDFAEHEIVEYNESIRIDIYSVETAYIIGDRDWSKFKLTSEMYFDDQMRLYCESAAGKTLLFYIYEGDVFNYTYGFLGAMDERTYKKQGEKNLEKMISEKKMRDTVTQLISSASEAYSWFTPYVKTDITSSEEYILSGDTQYFKTFIPEITTQAELEARLRACFTEDAVSDILKLTGESGEPIFTEQEGILYRLGGFTSEYTNSDVQFTFEIKSASDESATVTVTVEKTPDGEDIELTYDCRIKKVDDIWLFDSFELPIAHFTENKDAGNISGNPVITDIANWDQLAYSGSTIVYDLVQAIIQGNYSDIAEILGKGSAIDYVYLGPLDQGTYTLEKSTENGVSAIILKASDSVTGKNYTKYIRHIVGAPIMTDS